MGDEALGDNDQVTTKGLYSLDETDQVLLIYSIPDELAEQGCVSVKHTNM